MTQVSHPSSRPAAWRTCVQDNAVKAKTSCTLCRPFLSQHAVPDVYMSVLLWHALAGHAARKPVVFDCRYCPLQMPPSHTPAHGCGWHMAAACCPKQASCHCLTTLRCKSSRAHCAYAVAAKADVWACGVWLVALLTGSFPFHSHPGSTTSTAEEQTL
jgi:hypothetical protein